MTLDYFYGQAGELFSFYLIPKALFQETTVPEPVNRCQDPVRYPAGPHEPFSPEWLVGQSWAGVHHLYCAGGAGFIGLCR